MSTNPNFPTESASGLIPWRVIGAIREVAERRPRAESHDFPSTTEWLKHKRAMSTALHDVRRMLAYIESDGSGVTKADLTAALKLIPCLTQDEPGGPLRCFPWHPKLRAMLCATLMTVLVRDANACGTVDRLRKHLGPGCVSRWWP